MDRSTLLAVSKTALRTKLSADLADHLAEVVYVFHYANFNVKLLLFTYLVRC